MRKTALITGGASGIGAASARRLSRDGYRVCVVDRQESDADLEITRDVRDPAAAEEAVKACERVDALVCCAGVGAGEWDEILATNLTAAHRFIAAASPGFKAQGSGRVVLVSSTQALRARRGLQAYAASKAGLLGLMRAAARDLGPHGVTVNAVAPGLVETAMTAAVPDEIKARLKDETCLGRIARPEDVASVIAFLCSDDARHVTGEVIRVDGGQLA
jgi:3-oxoacyl-[acyl-carrier protein] reductase